MVNDDTIELLKECNAGIKMGVSAIGDVLDYTKDDKFCTLLKDCLKEHEKLQNETKEILNDYDDSGKKPNPMAKGMSWLKTNVMLTVEPSDNTVADLITDGCNMGVKSLNKYLNKYEAAEEKVKDITKRLINLEEKLAVDIRCYL